MAKKRTKEIIPEKTPQKRGTDSYSYEERTFRQTPQCFRIRIQWIKQSAMLAPPFFLELDAMSSPT